MPLFRYSNSAMELDGNHRYEGPLSDPMTSNPLELRVLGVSSDAGLTKNDCVLVQYRQDNPDAPLSVEVLKVDEIPLSVPVRNPILNSLRESQRRWSSIPHSNAMVGHMFSSTIKEFCGKHGIEPISIDLAGLRVKAAGRLSIPYPRGTPTNFRLWHRIVAEETGITTTVDFHTLEKTTLSHPLPPTAFITQLLLQHPSKFRVCLTIDELANLSFIPPESESHKRSTISRDCGPGNLLIDYAMRYCTSNDHCEDNNGQFAAQGTVNQELVNRFLQGLDYFRNPLPTNIAAEMFGDHDAQHLVDECIFLRMTEVDTIATITHITAQNILNQYHKLFNLHYPSLQQINELFICGPGAQNSSIVDFLEKELPQTVITKPFDDIGIPGTMIAAYCHAHLALETVRRSANQSSASTTSSDLSSREIITGSIATGTRWKEIAQHIRRFSDGRPLGVVKELNIVGDLEAGISGLQIQN